MAFLPIMIAERQKISYPKQYQNKQKATLTKLTTFPQSLRTVIAVLWSTFSRETPFTLTILSLILEKIVTNLKKGTK
jgi:hypothetical protein